MIPLIRNDLPDHFWNDLERNGQASCIIQAPDTLTHNSKYWFTVEEAPDFPRPGYSRKELNETGRLYLLGHYNNVYVPGYWTVQRLNGKITCYEFFKDLEHVLNSYHYDGSGLVDPDGRRLKITATLES